jgi:hypothetical protein
VAGTPDHHPHVDGRDRRIRAGRGRRLPAPGPNRRTQRRADQAFAADTLLPEAYTVEGILTGPLVVTGFAISLALSAI